MTGTVSRLVPIATVVAAIMVVWYGFTVYLNSPWQIDRYEKAGIEWQMEDLVRDTMAQERPILPAPHRLCAKSGKRQLKRKSPRNARSSSSVTPSSTLLGFAMEQSRIALRLDCREPRHGQTFTPGSSPARPSPY